MGFRVWTFLPLVFLLYFTTCRASMGMNRAGLIIRGWEMFKGIRLTMHS